jgi:hypothetical protein
VVAAVVAIRTDFIETFTGRRFRPLDPVVEDIDIRDIAHALSHQCRFSGHTIAHYSVAEHSVRVRELLERRGASRVVQLWGLLHDASEAYLVDIPSPLKCTPVFDAYREAEARLMLAICQRFELSQIEPPEVKKADGELVATEARDLMAYRPEHWIGLKEAPLPGVIKPWTSASARNEFLAAFEELSK